MSSKKWEFPHPLLAAGRDDYSHGSFDIIEGSHRTAAEIFIFSFRYDLNCPGLEEYIKNGNADVVLNVSSSAAKFRKEFCFSADSHTVEVPIQKNDIVKNVEFTAYVVAHGDDSFRLPEHNAEYYNNATFSLRKGDILAISSTISVLLDDSQLQKPIASIFNICEYTGDEEISARVNFTEKIEVYLAPKTYRQYDLLKQRHPSLRRALSAIVTLPALVNAIELMTCGDDESRQYERDRWYLSIHTKLEKKGIDLNDENMTMTSTEVANIIYEDIIFDALNSIKTILDRTIDPEFQELGGMD